MLDMYYTQPLEVPLETTMEKIYSMNNTLNAEGNMSSPKKENMFQSMFSALNGIWEHFSKVPGSFMTNINNPLSVTLVHNEGIISHDFFKSLTIRKEPTDNGYIHDSKTKMSLNIVDSIHCTMLDEKQSCPITAFTESTSGNFKSSYNYVDAKQNGTVEKSAEKTFLIEGNLSNSMECKKSEIDKTTEVTSLSSVNSSKINGLGKMLDHSAHSDVGTNNTHIVKDCCNFIPTSKEDTSREEFFNCIGDTVINKSSITCESHTPDAGADEGIAISNLLTNMWQKVVCGVTDRFNPVTESVDCDATMKRSSSPKHRRKLNAVAKGRGRGRARSQLRRSGVSQTRHRKERSKHDLVVDIQNDFKSWQDFEIYHSVESDECNLDCFDMDDNKVGVPNAAEYVLQDNSMCPIIYTFADVKPRSRKPQARKNEMRVRYLPESAVETNAFRQDYNEKLFDLQRNAFRPRLMSESSVDSEDSYCVVFETGSEINCKSDYEDSEETDEDQSSEDGESASTMHKVKFNLKPTVHLMVQWDYAYRAARVGPWEEMARDRDRFKGRIKCIERVLNPILTIQHRTHIWQERFAFKE